MTNIIQTNPQYWARRRMYAEIIFLGDNTVGPVAERLRELGFDLEILDWPGEDPTSTITAFIATPLGAFAFYDHVQAIVGPLGGDVMEAGFGAASPQELDG